MTKNKKRLVIPNSSIAIRLTRSLVDNLEIFTETPEDCTNLFFKNNADYALLSPFEYAVKSDFYNLGIISSFAISLTDTSKDSILLFSKNRTKISNIAYRKGYPYESYLTKIIFTENYDTPISFSEFDGNLDEALKKVDALLLSGDEALENSENPSTGLLLAEEWFLMTGLPYVSYLLVARSDEVDNDDISFIKNIFNKPKEDTEKDEVKDEEHLISDVLSSEDDYYEEFEEDETNYIFEFGEDQKKSIEEYYNYLFSYSIIENIPDLNLID